MARLRYADISTPADAHLVQDTREQRDEVPHLYRQVPDAVHANVRRFFDDKGVVELTALAATYNMVSRFLEALEIHSTGAME